MQKLKILNSREIKKMREIALSSFGYFPKANYVYLQNDKNKVFIVNNDLKRIDLRNLRIDKIGLYLAEFKNNQLRLSKEGAQFFTSGAEKNNQQLLPF